MKQDLGCDLSATFHGFQVDRSLLVDDEESERFGTDEVSRPHDTISVDEFFARLQKPCQAKVDDLQLTSHEQEV